MLGGGRSRLAYLLEFTAPPSVGEGGREGARPAILPGAGRCSPRLTEGAGVARTYGSWHPPPTIQPSLNGPPPRSGDDLEGQSFPPCQGEVARGGGRGISVIGRAPFRQLRRHLPPPTFQRCQEASLEPLGRLRPRIGGRGVRACRTFARSRRCRRGRDNPPDRPPCRVTIGRERHRGWCRDRRPGPVTALRSDRSGSGRGC